MKINNKIRMWYFLLIGYWIIALLLIIFGFFDINYNTYNIFEWIIAIIFFPIPSMIIMTLISLSMIETLEGSSNSEDSPKETGEGK